MTLLPDAWETERLAIRNALPADVPQFRDAFNACAYVEPWDPTFRIYPDEEFVEIVRRSNSGGDDDTFRAQAMTLKGDGDIIGYFHCYHGVPNPNALFISMFVINPRWQKHRYGGEVIEGVAQVLPRPAYNAIWLAVYLKNWPALRFWIAHGFTSVREWRGDTEHSDTAHARLILERLLALQEHQ